MTLTTNTSNIAFKAMWIPRKNRRRYAAPSVFPYSAWTSENGFALTRKPVVAYKTTRSIRVDLH